MPDQDLSVEDRAAQLGHVPQDQWKGAPDKWVDAETFMARAEEALPLAKSNLKKLSAQLAKVEGTVEQQKAIILQNQKTMEDFQKFQSEFLESSLKAQEARIRAELREARSEGDDALEGQLEEKLDDIKTQRRELKEKPVVVVPPVDTPVEDPQFIQWKSEHEWYGVDEDRTALADSQAILLRRNPNNQGIKGKAFYDMVAKATLKILPLESDDSPAASKVDTGRSSISASGTGKTAVGYNSLPAEAKAQCDKDGQRFVGEGKMFKDQSAWRTHYVKLYNQARGA